MRFSRVRLTDDTPIHCKPYPLPYAMREELRNEEDSILEMGEVRPSKHLAWLRRNMVLTGCVLT